MKEKSIILSEKKFERKYIYLDFLVDVFFGVVLFLMIAFALSGV